MKIFYITLIFLITSKIDAEDKYNRNSFHFHSYPTKTDIGFYTKKHCKTNIDHVVSLKDAKLGIINMISGKAIQCNIQQSERHMDSLTVN